MLTLLAAIRDFLIVVALAWAGVSIDAQSRSDRSCIHNECDAQSSD
jgi:hypothetical protein